MKIKNIVAAFTLIELSLVIALIAIIAGLVLTNSSFIDRFIVRAEADKLAATCRYLRQLAMSTNTEYRLAFDIENKTYHFKNNTERLASRVHFGTGKNTLLGPPSAPTKPITDPITFVDHTIIFHPDGIISAGIVYLSDSAGKYVYAVSCAVSGISFLRTYVYDGTWKLLN